MEKKTLKVGYAMSTWRKVKEFQDGLKGIEDKIPMPLIRRYLLTGEKSDDISSDIYDEIDRLQDVRSAGIQGEMRYAIAQARKNGIDLKENITSGKDIRPGFSKKVLERIPSLGIYTHFMWYTEKELEKLNSDIEKPQQSSSAPDKDDDDEYYI